MACRSSGHLILSQKIQSMFQHKPLLLRLRLYFWLFMLRFQQQQWARLRWNLNHP